MPTTPDLRNWGKGRPSETYTYKTPDGQTLDVQSDHPLSPDEIRQVFKAAGVNLKLPGDVPQPTMLDAMTKPTSYMTDSPAPDYIKNFVENPMVQGAAHPQGLGDIMALLLPNFAGQSLQLGGEAMAAGAKAHPDLGPIRSRLAGIVDRWKNVAPVTDVERVGTGLGKDVPLPTPPRPSVVTQPAAGKMAEARASAPPPPASTPGQPDIWDQMLAEARAGRKPSGPPPVLRKGPSAPSVSETLKGALDEAGAPNPAKGTTPPSPTTTPMGKPSITAEQYAQGERAAAQPVSVKPAPKPAAPTTGKADKFAEIPDDPRVADIVDRMAQNNAGQVPGNGTGGPKAIEDAITELRRKYGANRVGKTVNPKAPEAGTGTVLRADASQAPSAMPDMAQKAVLRDLRAGTSKNPAATARAVEQLLKEYGRNKGPANSDVARELADLLKQYGFKTGIE